MQSDNSTQRESQKDIAAKAGYLTTAEAARRAGVNVTTIYRLINRSKIESVTVGQQRFVIAKSLAAHYGAIQTIYDRIMAGVEDETSNR
jgi:excisionase family DNA binding protein